MRAAASQDDYRGRVVAPERIAVCEHAPRIIAVTAKEQGEVIKHPLGVRIPSNAPISPLNARVLAVRFAAIPQSPTSPNS